MKRITRIAVFTFVLLALLDFGYILYYKSSTPGKASALLQEGIRLTSSGKYDDAKAVYEEALSLSKTIIDEDGTLGIMSAQTGLANIHIVRGNYQEALKLYEQNLESYEQWREPKSIQVCTIGIITYANIGLLRIYLGDLTEAKRYLDTAIAEIEILTTADSCQNQIFVSKSETISNLEYSIYFNQALLYRNLGNYEQARINYERVLLLDLNEQEQKNAHAQLGVAYLMQGNIDTAKNHIIESENLIALGLLNLAQQDYQTAIENFQSRIEAAEQRQEVAELFAGHMGLGLAYEELGNYTLASSHYANAAELTEDIQNSLPERFKQTFLEAKMYGFSRGAPYEGLKRIGDKDVE